MPRAVNTIATTQLNGFDIENKVHRNINSDLSWWFKIILKHSVNHAIEIKSSKDPLGNEVSISSLEQLSSDFEFHYLRRYGLVETLEGQTIKDLYYSIHLINNLRILH